MVFSTSHSADDQLMIMNQEGGIPPQRTSIHVMALDSMVNVNSLFTFAVFVGLAWNLKDPSYILIGITDPCVASSAMAEDFVKYHVYSFSSFLFSSLIALGLKQGISGGAGRAKDEAVLPGQGHGAVGHVNLKVLRGGILVSASGSVAGCVFLMLALVDLVQIKMGRLDCRREWYTVAAVVPLVTLTSTACFIRFPFGKESRF